MFITIAKIGITIGIFLTILGMVSLLPALDLSAHAVAGMTFFVKLIAPLNFLFPMSTLFTILFYIFLFETILFVCKGVVLMIDILPLGR